MSATAKIKWEYSFDLELRRLAYTYKNIHMGFYKLNGFQLGYFNTTNKTSYEGVLIPHIDVTGIPRFWQKVARTKGNVDNISVDTDLYANLKNEIAPFECPPDINSLKTCLKVYEDLLLTTLSESLYLRPNQINSITLVPTKYGTKTAYAPITNDNSDLYLILREDATIGNLIATLVYSLVRTKSKELNAEWLELRFLVDYIMSTPPFVELLSTIGDGEKYGYFLKRFRSLHNSQAIEKSKEVYKDLGLSHEYIKFSLVNGAVFADGVRLKDLTQSESKILELLIENKDSIVSYDLLGEVLFNSPDKFSLEAIVKTIQRLRNKLEKNDISSTYIQTVYKKGYILVS